LDLSFFLHFLIPAFGSNFLFILLGKERSKIFPLGRVRNSHSSLHERELLTTPSMLCSESEMCIQGEWRHMILFKETVKLLISPFLKLTCPSFKRFLRLITELWSMLTVSVLTIEDVYFIMLIISLKWVVTLSTTRINIHKFYVLPTKCIFMFCMDPQNKQWLLLSTALTSWFS
jgi:hypothetical protein